MLDRSVAANAAGASLNGVPPFDSRPLQALRAELASRVQARGDDFVVDRWEVRPSFAPSRAGAGGRFWLVRDLVGLCIVSAALGAVALPSGLFQDRQAPSPAPIATPAKPIVYEPEPVVRLVLPAAVEIPAAPTPPLPARAPVEAAPAEPPAGRPASSSYARDDLTPAFDCRAPLSFTEERVCANPILQEQNAALGAAFRQAQVAGAPEAQLYREQDDWARARNEAAYTAPGRLAGLYAARIAALTRQAQTAQSAQP